MMRWCFVSILFLACAHEPAQHIVLSVRGLDCFECADKFVPALRAQAGVRDVRFDRAKAEVVVEADLGVQAQALTQVIEHAGYEARVGAGQGAYLPPATYPPGADVAVVGRRGEDVARLEPAAGKVTVIDFYAEWCGPCHEVDQHLAELLARRSDVAVRKIEILDWDSPAARHWLADAREIPYQVIFDRRGQRVAAIAGFDLARLDAAIEAAAR